MKKVVSFALAVVLACSCFVGVAFASDGDRGDGFDTLMDITLSDGTVISVPRRLGYYEFVIARNADGLYRAYIFDNVDGVYEGATDVNYQTSVGRYSSFDISPLELPPTWDSDQWPYYLVGYRYISGTLYGDIFLFNDVSILTWKYETYPNAGYAMYQGTTTVDMVGKYMCCPHAYPGWSALTDRVVDAGGVVVGYYEGVYHNFDMYDKSGKLLFAANSSLSDEWRWTDFSQSQFTRLDITAFGEIVYQSFDYSLTAPDPGEPSDPEESSSPDLPDDDSDVSLFDWLKMQWVFLLQKLQDIVDAIKNLSVDLDPYPDKTKPLLDDFFTNIFDNGVGEEDVVGLGGVLQNVRHWFSTDFKLGDLWDLFDEEYMTSWFTEDTRLAIDSTGGELNGG